jgi:hypothetical protein
MVQQAERRMETPIDSRMHEVIVETNTPQHSEISNVVLERDTELSSPIVETTNEPLRNRDEEKTPTERAELGTQKNSQPNVALITFILILVLLAFVFAVFGRKFYSRS